MNKYFEAMYGIYMDAVGAYYRYFNRGYSDAKEIAYKEMMSQFWGVSSVATHDMDLGVGEFEKIIDEREHLIDKFYKQF